MKHKLDIYQLGRRYRIETSTGHAARVDDWTKKQCEDLRDLLCKAFGLPKWADNGEI